MVHFYTRISFFLGIFLGWYLGKWIFLPNQPKAKEITYEKWFQRTKFQRKLLSWDVLRYNVSKEKIYTEDKLLYDTIWVVCVVLVRNKKNVAGVQDVKKTKLAVKRLPEHSTWTHLCRTFLELSGRFHWVLVAYDDVFVLMENLRYFVGGLDPETVHYLGHVVEFWGVKYNTGKAGYLLSSEAVKALKTELNALNCSASNAFWNREDFYLGKIMEKLHYEVGDTKDHEGFSTFFPYNLNHVFFPQEGYYRTSFYPTKCCSKRTITFQAIEGDKMYTYNYLLYKLQVFRFGGNQGNTQNINNKTLEESVWKEFLRERGILYNISDAAYYEAWENIVQDPATFSKHLKSNFDYE